MSVSRRTTGSSLPTVFPTASAICPRCLRKTAAELGIRHKLIRPYTPRHNGKVERSHREDQKRFYSCHSFYSLEDFENSLPLITAVPTTCP